MANVVSMSYLLEAGVHFGHQTKRWNPKMKEYIFTTRDDIYIIDLQKTLACMEEAYAKISDIAKNGGTFLFVGTKKQASEAAKEEAEAAKREAALEEMEAEAKENHTAEVEVITEKAKEETEEN